MSYDVAIIGCGYVGMTLAAAFNKAGLKVLGVEPREEIRKKVDAGIAPLHEPGLAEAMRGITMRPSLRGEEPADAYVICVSTPMVDDGALERATHEVAANADDGALVIVRSTVRIGTTRKVVKPILDATGPFDLAYCPERTIEGAALAELENLPQIIGADTVEAGDRASELFRHVAATRLVHIITGQPTRIERQPNDYLCTIEEAETAKLLANAWRDTTFAFANEVALLCDLNGVSARNAIEAANYRYERSQIPRPGPVGGPCLAKDSSLLLERKTHVFSVIRAARQVNHPAGFADAIYRAMDRRGFKQKGRVAVLGTAFKGYPPTDDTRDSPGLEIARLIRLTHEVVTVDPVAPASLLSIVGERFDVIVVSTDADWDWGTISAALNPSGFIYDCCWAAPSEMQNVVRFGG